MKGINRIQWCSTLLLAFGLTACKVERPETVLPDAKMENVLYDYHIAKAMGEEVPYNESYKRVLYIESVFKKHGITQADFDTSMVWFARNPEVLTKIYEKVNVRLKAERDGVNHLIALRDNKPKESLPGDSVDVWPGERLYRLAGMPLDNKITFTLPSDTNFHDRDTLCWNVHFHFYKGMPDSITPFMAMQVVYEKNDTVVSGFRRVEADGLETITLFADTLGKIKEVRGFIYYPMQEQDTLRPLLADRISLMRYHAADSLLIAPKDSLRQAGDSLLQSDTKRPASLEVKGIKEVDAGTNPPVRTAPRPHPELKKLEQPRR